MCLVDDGEAVVGKPFDQPDLPQRLRAVESLRGDATHEPAQLFFGAGTRQRRVPYVVGDREVDVVYPERAAGLQRRVDDPLAVPRDEMQPTLDMRRELFDGWRRA